MTTERLELGEDEYQQITDGTNSAFVQVLMWPGYSEMLWTDSPSKPATDAPAHDKSGEITFSPPLVIWVKSKSRKSLLHITRWKS